MSPIAKDIEYIYRYIPARKSLRPKTVVLFHGTGGDENDLIPLAEAVAPESNILSLRGRVLENGQARFFRRLSDGVFDLDDIKVRSEEIAKFIEKLSGIKGFDLSRLAGLGYSNGANMIASIMLLFPRLFSAAILLRPMIPFTPEKLPDLSGTSVFISSGKYDRIVPKEHPEGLAKILRDSGADVIINWTDADHPLEPGEIEKARAWYDDAMSGDQ